MPVVLKVISTSLLGRTTAEERILREAHAAAQLRHPNVALVFHLGKHAESHYYAMEFIAAMLVARRRFNNGQGFAPDLDRTARKDGFVVVRALLPDTSGLRASRNSFLVFCQ